MTEEKSSEEKKIIVDEDWKTEAKKEKEKLAETQATEKEDSAQQEQNLPPGDLQALISMLAMQTLFALGLIVPQDEKDKKPEPNIKLAKYNIDMLETLEEKTKGNLTEDEQAMLTNALSQVRMAFVEASK